MRMEVHPHTGGGRVTATLRYMGTNSADREEGWHRQECSTEETTGRRRRKEDHKDRTKKEKGVWREKQEVPREGKACTDG